MRKRTLGESEVSCQTKREREEIAFSADSTFCIKPLHPTAEREREREDGIDRESGSGLDSSLANPLMLAVARNTIGY